jgi:hypothetical protein
MNTLRNVVLVILLLAIVVVVTMTGTQQCASDREVIELPLDLADIIPQAWEPQDKQLPTVDIDGDDEPEWLLIYRYDSAREGRGPIGGVIYDAQVDISPHDLGEPIPYRSAFLVPYKLLPDTRPGKGQGYLADVRVAEPESTDVNGDGRADELILKGHGHDPAVTRLSIFRWEGKEEGYSVQHFHGSGGITSEDQDSDGVLEKIAVLDLLHERSQFCRKRTYTRQDGGTYWASDPSVVFCYGVPKHAFYPEGVVLTFLLSSKQKRQAELAKASSEAGLMTASGRREAEQLGLGEVGAYRALQFSYPGVVLSSSEGVAEAGAGMRSLEQAEIWTDVVADGQERTYCWRVLNTSSPKINEDTVWRIDGLCNNP